jgi:hypothetical protein
MGYHSCMSTQKLASGTVHDLPKDFEKALGADPKVAAAWNDITPLARNEFICWVISPAKPETRVRRITIALDKLGRGERRPCCWIGCIHRPDKAISPSVAGILGRRKSRTA